MNKYTANDVLEYAKKNSISNNEAMWALEKAYLIKIVKEAKTINDLKEPLIKLINKMI